MGSRMTPRTDNRSENEARRKLDLYLATEHGWHGEAPVRIFIDESRDLLDEALATERRMMVDEIRNGLWFLNPTQQAEANKVLAASLPTKGEDR